MEDLFNFLRVKDGRTYFARVSVVSDPDIDRVRLSATAGAQNSRTPERWLEAAHIGADRAWQAHIAIGGSKVGLMIKSVVGTEVDTSESTIEVAAFCAAWKALGHSENELKFEFDQEWRVKK